jgi:RNA polymerase sigma-70 factor (ECF subfamily)
VHERRAGVGDVDEHARVVEQFVEAALRPIRGVDKVLRFLTAVRSEDTAVSTTRGVNGGVAVVVHVAGRLDAVATVRVQGGLITELHVVRNPDKVAGVASGVAVRLTR